MPTDLGDDIYLITGPAARTDPVPGPDAIGNKAHNLARMADIGLRVPPAFAIGTSWCARADAMRPAHWQPAVGALQETTGCQLGDPRRPLLLSVRSGAAVSMPGMMETLLNIGLNDDTVHGLVRGTGNPRLAWDAYRRLVAGFGEVVLGVPPSAFEADLLALAEPGRDERELDFDAVRRLAHAHLRTVERLTGQPFPQDPWQQLGQAIDAVFRSWHTEKAQTYRRLKGIADRPGTAVTVQVMVFGNAGGDSGAGVGFTRHPSTGEPQPWVDYLFNAQGEDVVSGRRSALGHDELQAVAPAVWQELLDGMARLEAEFADMQDFEFTVERGRLYWLQTRNGKRTPQATARIALDLVDAGRIDRREALRRTEGLDEAALAETVLAAQGGVGSAAIVAQAQSACTGVVVGEIALDEARVRERQAGGAATVLLRPDAETSDIGALDLAGGLLTSRGARTSHAAVVARQLGKVCLVGCSALEIDLTTRRVRLGGRDFAEGEVLTLDGHSGTVYAGAMERCRRAPEALLARLQTLRDAGGT
ncbi:MAG: PEP/pyruvate-binding domain-containing protein [Rubrivivax sp.]|jgi:pyruvate,orthophosphate dikinase